MCIYTSQAIKINAFLLFIVAYNTLWPRVLDPISLRLEIINARSGSGSQN